MFSLRSSLAALAITVLAVAPASAQQPSSLVSAFSTDVSDLKGKLVGLADAMPEGSYAWRPMEGVRTVADVYKHVISDNYLLAAVAGHPAPESTGILGESYGTAVAYEARSMTKAEIVVAMKASFEHLEMAVGATSAAQLSESVTVFGMDMTVQGLWLLTLTHLHEHLGQSIAYARSNGVVPPWSR